MKSCGVYLSLAAMMVMVLPDTAGAGCRTFSTITHHAPVVEKVIVEKQVAVAAVYLPLYSAVYLPQAVPGYTVPGVAGAVPGVAPAAPVDPCAELRQRYNLLEQRLQRLEGGQVPTPGTLPPRTAPAPMPPAENGHGEAPRQGAAPAAGGSFIAWATPRCGACHDATNAAAKGGKFTLLAQGRLAELSPEKTGEVIRRLSLPDGHPESMPKGSRITPTERLEGVRLFVESN